MIRILVATVMTGFALAVIGFVIAVIGLALERLEK